MDNATNTALQVADDALEFLQYGHDHLKWLTAPMKAIQLDAKHNQGKGSNDLASIGHYLNSDCANYLDCQTKELQSQLDTVGGWPMRPVGWFNLLPDLTTLPSQFDPSATLSSDQAEVLNAITHTAEGYGQLVCFGMASIGELLARTAESGELSTKAGPRAPP